MKPEAHSKIRVVIVAQALAVRLGWRALIQSTETIEVSGEAASVSLVEVDLRQVDVVLVVGGEAMLEALATIPHPAAVLLLTDSPQAVQALWDYPNAWGVLGVDASADELEAAVRALKQGLVVGEAYLLRSIRPAGLAAPNPYPEGLPNGQALTSRELEVLQRLSQGLANKQIGLALSISEHTVKFHVSAIYTKLGASNRTEAVRFGVQRGLVTL